MYIQLIYVTVQAIYVGMRNVYVNMIYTIFIRMNVNIHTSKVNRDICYIFNSITLSDRLVLLFLVLKSSSQVSHTYVDKFIYLCY